MLWFFIRFYNRTQQFFDFGNGKEQDNIMLLFRDHSCELWLYIIDEYHIVNRIYIPGCILKGRYYHIAITYRNREINVYYDSSLILSQSINNPIKNTIRDSNFIGKSMNSDNVQDGSLDEFDEL